MLMEVWKSKLVPKIFLGRKSLHFESSKLEGMEVGKYAGCWRILFVIMMFHLHLIEGYQYFKVGMYFIWLWYRKRMRSPVTSYSYTLVWSFPSQTTFISTPTQHNIMLENAYTNIRKSPTARCAFPPPDIQETFWVDVTADTPMEIFPSSQDLAGKWKRWRHLTPPIWLIRSISIHMKQRSTD